MKRKLLSLILALVMIACAAPVTFSSGAAESTEWTPVNFNYLEAESNGFSVPADGDVAREIVLWNGLLYEGKFSVDIKTSAIKGASGEHPGIFFGGKGIENITATNTDVKSAAYYRAYFDQKGSTLVIGAIHNGTWISGYKTGRNADLKKALTTEKWNEIFSAETVKLTVAFSQTGAAIFYINDIEVLRIASNGEGYQVNNSLIVRKDCVPYGGQIAYDNGAANVAGGASNLTVYGGLEFKTLQGGVNYDENTYTFTTTADQSFGYFTNRFVRNGKIVIISKNLGANGNGPIFGVHHTDEASKREGNGLSYYIVDANANRFCAWSGHEANHHTKMTTSSSTALQSNNGKWIFGSNASGAISSVDFNLTKSPAAIVLNAKNTVTVTDSAPFEGGYYGIRIDNKDKTLAYYVVNNEAEAMALELVSVRNEGGEGKIVVKTFPEGSVINSGDKITLSGNGVQQVGDATDNGNGTYTINYTKSAGAEGAVSLSVDNHIFGTLELDVDVSADFGATPDDDNSGDAEGDSGNTDNGNTGDGNTDSGNTDSGNTDNGNTDNGNTDSGNTDSGNTDSDEPKDPNAGADNGDANNEASTENGAGDETKKLPTLLIAIAAAFAALVIVAIIVIIVKKKKK